MERKELKNCPRLILPRYDDYEALKDVQTACAGEGACHPPFPRFLQQGYSAGRHYRTASVTPCGYFERFCIRPGRYR